MIIEKLDGPKGDPILDGGNNVTGTYQGIVTGTAADLVDGDWARWSNDDGSFVAEHRWYAPQPAPSPVPNNPGNPYFGKKPLTPKDFWGLVLTVYIALASGATAAGLDRQGRLLSSKRALGVLQVIDGVTVIDVDDKGGAFLKLLDILTTTNHEDGALLMELTEAAAIMTAWQ